VFDHGSDSLEPSGRSEPLPRYASVTIIGGGVMGVSTAFHLARAGVGSVLVIERNLLGSGSSAKPLGGVRATFSDPGNIVLAQRSLEAYERFGAELGSTSAFGRWGTSSYAAQRPPWLRWNRRRNYRTASAARRSW
jgi:glycine/D-amino acid oxidase-like deaminating enzyme